MQGQSIELGVTEITLGRDAGNTISLEDRAASRRHCVLRPVDGRFQIADLDSRNGTYVNGLPVRERLLQHNDQIRVGDSVFLFQRKAAEADGALVELDGAITNNASTVWKSGPPVYLDKSLLEQSLLEQSILEKGGALPNAALGGRTVRGLQVLLRISQAVQGAQSVESLQQHVLDVLLEAIPAVVGVIVLNQLPSTFAVHRKGGSAAVHLPADAVQQILQGRAGLRSQESDGSWLVAVPLLFQEQVEGLLYLKADVVLDDGHLELAAAVGVIAGMAIHNLLRWESLRAENERLQASVHASHDMIGSSAAMAKVYRFVAQAAPTDSTVLIGGESGTGKELVARALHRNSPRAAKAFVAINCAALTESLLEDEMFGHERGAFTGAIAQKKGKFESADGGTLFLDEVGELAPALQAKLLRVLQERDFERVGGTRPIQVDVRIIAATNRDLQAAVKEQGFRQDLFFRLNVLSVVLPALRERREDIALLAGHFVRKLSQKTKRRVNGLSPAAVAALRKYDWPGNVRELENAVERAVVLGSSDVLLPEDLPESVLEASDAAWDLSADQPAELKLGDFQQNVNEAKRRAVREALDRAGGVYTEAAKLLGVHPNYLHRLVKNLGLR